MSHARLLIALCCMVAAFVCLVTLTLDRRTPLRRRGPRNNSKSVVLLWTPFFGNADYLPTPQEKSCEYQDCLLTSNRSVLDASSAVVFHAPETSLSDLPIRRTTDQLWVIFALESPLHTGSLSGFDGLFNWTATYRMDSDLWTPYDHVTKLERPVKIQKDYWKGKTKMVAWFNSNCHTNGGRELYVKELEKLVPVDVYGSCGKLDCSPKMSFDCYRRAAKEYYFYLSFENSLCKDYVTEKFFHILQFDMVPVVFGCANYSAIAPPGSYVDALDFPSPQDLGRHLKAVAANDTLYNSYFRWRETHTLGGYHWVCELCRRLRTNDVTPQIYKNLDQWWLKEAKCKSWTQEGLKPT